METINKDTHNQGEKWITVMNKRSQLKKKESDIHNKLKINKDDDNMKKMLCNNILVSGECHYGDKCMYAHTLAEQNMDAIRRKAYDIIFDKEKISYRPDKELGRVLLQLTKVCDDCIKNKCPGGYNCKYGVFDKKYQVCIDDLRYGICYNTQCNNIHLTNKGLIPLNSTNKNETLNIIKYADKIKNINIPDGTLLSDDFFIRLGKNNKSKNLNDRIDSDSEDSTERIKEYLDHNSDSDKSCNESIFD